MGSSFSLVLYGADRTRLEAAADPAFQEAHRLDAMLSNYRPESEWSRVNREAAAHPVEVSPELFSVLSSCLEYSRQSDGAFDITVGRTDEGLGILQRRGAHAAANRRRRRRSRRWAIVTSCSTPAPEPSGSPAPASSSTPEESARATPWTGWSTS